jgi:preprotein translocase subunit SecF
MELIKSDTSFDFMGKSRIAIIISALMILIGIASIIFHGGLKYGIDFSGGTLVQLKFKTAPSLQDIRDGLKSMGLDDSTIQEFGSPNDILIRVQRTDGKLEAVGEDIRNALGKKLNKEDISVERVEMVGPKVGKDLHLRHYRNCHLYFLAF